MTATEGLGGWVVANPIDSVLDEDDFRAAMERSGVTQADIVRETGLDATTVSRICRGLYTADTDAVEMVVGMIDRTLGACGLAPMLGDAPIQKVSVVRLATAQASASGGAPNAGTVPIPDAVPGLLAPWGGAWCTGGQRLLWSALRATLQDRELGVLAALPGTGKTYLIARYRESYPQTLVYRPLRGISQSGLLEDLCRLFSAPYSGSNDTRRRRLLDAAQGHDLIIDEADLLVSGRYARAAVDRLEIYRQLQERGTAVVLVGLPALFRAIVGGGETYVFSRIGYARTCAPPSSDELAVYWRARMAGYPQAAAKAGLVALSAARHGHLRYLDKLARRARALNGDVAAAETLLFRGEQS